MLSARFSAICHSKHCSEHCLRRSLAVLSDDSGLVWPELLYLRKHRR